MRDTLNDYSLTAYVQARNCMQRFLDRVERGEWGQTTAEYVAIIVLISGVIALAASNNAVQEAVVETISAAFKRVRNLVSGGES